MIAKRELRIKEAVDLFLTDRTAYYDTGEGPTRQLANVRSGLERWLVRFVGDRWLYELDGVMLDELLGKWVNAGHLGRTSINRNLSFVRQLMKFCVRRGFARPDQLVQVQSVDRLRRGRYGITEPEPIRPADQAAYLASLEHLPELSRAVAEMLFLTGMRPGEVRLMLVADLGIVTEKGRERLLYVPEKHKTWHANKRRSVPITGGARAILEARLKTIDPTSPGYVFSRDGRGWDPMPENRLGKDIRRACRAAGVEIWRPNQLRHAWATKARAMGIKMTPISQAMGHSSTRTTEIYAEPADLALFRTMERVSAGRADN